MNSKHIFPAPNEASEAILIKIYRGSEMCQQFKKLKVRKRVDSRTGKIYYREEELSQLIHRMSMLSIRKYGNRIYLRIFSREG